MSFTPQKKRRLRVKKLVLVLVAIYVMIGAGLYLLQEKMLFLPTVLPQEHMYSFNHPFEEVYLFPDDGASLNGIHFKVESPKGVILYFHGNAGDLQRWGEITEYFVKLNYDVLVMDYRGYGKSTGKRSESAFYSDGQLFYNYLLQRYSEEDITVYGRSLGSGVATKMTATNAPKQLILESPYYSIADVAKHRFPMFPVKSLLTYRFPNYENLMDIACPTFILHGTDDYVVPFSSGEKLSKISSKSEVHLIPILNGGHNDLVDFESYHKGIRSILEE